MKRDERISRTENEVCAIGYWLLWLGIFVVLIYRWYILGLSLLETIDIFIVWLGVSLFVGSMRAARGVPLVQDTESFLKSYLINHPVAAGILAVIITFVTGRLDTLRTAITVFAVPMLVLMVIYIIWGKLYSLWFTKHLE